MPKPSSVSIAMAFALVSAGPACAQTEANADTSATATGDIVVSALRVPVALDRVASSIAVLDTAELQQAQPVALTDVLVTTPGISLVRNGGYGETTSLRIRGADPGQTIMVVDGMRMADTTATDGGFDFSQLFVDDIARVEVLRGPQAILWGSDAIGGIVNVTTVAPSAPLQGDFSVEAGSHETLNAHAGLGGTSSLVDWRISASEFTTAGIPSMTGGTVANPYRRQAASGTATFHLAPNVSLDVRGYWDNGRNSFSDNFSLGTGAIYAGDYELAKQWSLYAGLNVAALDGRLKNRLAVLQDQTDMEQYTPVDSPALQFVGHGVTRRYEYQGSLAMTKGIDLVFGAEREEQHMEVGSPYDLVMAYELTPRRVATDSVYGELRVSPARGLTVTGGVRYDHNSQFGGNTVFSAGAAWTPDGGATLLRASYDQGYKAPSLFQLYSDYGNAGLQPEKARGWEVGAERALLGRAAHLSAAWFERNSSNLISFEYCPFSGAQPAICYVPGTATQRFGYYANIDVARARGLELAGDVRRGRLFADANYSIVVSEDRTPGSATFGMQLPRVPRHLFNGEAGLDWTHRLTTSAVLRWSGSSYDDVYSTLAVGGYTLVDIRAEWKLPRSLTLFGRVENIGDRRYQTAYGYNSLGRVAYLGLRGSF